MAVKFSTCYPTMPHGMKAPCGIVTDQQQGILQEIICPEIPVELCSQLVATWRDRYTEPGIGKDFEEVLCRFITDELKQRQCS